MPKFAYTSYCFYEVLPFVKEIREVFVVGVVLRVSVRQALDQNLVVCVKCTLIYVVSRRRTRYRIIAKKCMSTFQ